MSLWMLCLRDLWSTVHRVCGRSIIDLSYGCMWVCYGQLDARSINEFVTRTSIYGYDFEALWSACMILWSYNKHGTSLGNLSVAYTSFGEHYAIRLKRHIRCMDEFVNVLGSLWFFCKVLYKAYDICGSLGKGDWSNLIFVGGDSCLHSPQRKQWIDPR